MEDKELLIKLVQGLKTLDESQFDYSEYVAEYDNYKDCGTVCCAWGWVPALVPESGIRWIRGAISVFHNDYKWKTIDQKQSDFMFLGEPNPHEFHDEELFGDNLDSTLEQVINRIEYIINLL